MNPFLTDSSLARSPRTLRACLSAIATAACLVGVAHAEPALVQGKGVAITPSDMRADAERMPPEMRNIVLSEPGKVGQLAENLYIRRVLAQRAVAQGMDKDSSTAAALAVAHDKVLSDALLAAMDKKNMPSDTDLEAMAKTVYQASPERFKTGEQVHIRHILLPKEGDNARADAEAVLKQLKNGADFAALAKERSKDPGSAAKGGDLGTFEHGRMVPEFDKAAFELQKPGDLSNIVETKFGYHILQLVDKKPAAIKSYAEVHDALVQEQRGKALHDARMAEVTKIQQASKPDKAAIEAFAAGYKEAAAAAIANLPQQAKPAK